MINAVSPVSRVYNQPKGFNSYHKAHKISTLPPELSLDKPREKSITELLSPLLIIAGCLIVGALYGWFVTIARHI